ncbi:NAD(P)H-dependent oxidoreductase [Massilia sp. CF038]|uniref:glutathione-regulated potassium-efflux system oxidoreductase KefF n=1 Tax=Massilia sp. CF038 TaxID=1881045 RepID=UPI00091B7B2D|nr:NAD(P)H-dependent oxidoreductase [Massilia sp. CF038]SHH14541.1 Kef-type potassium/proton antiporter accessory protein, CPA2 family [Massilia sp. CF038]
MSEKILVIYAHATTHKSRVNRRLAQAARTIPGVRVHDLYETYPDFHIDVAAEQALLADADVIVFVHPFQWYSMPALLKEWVDCVLQAGWAYGAGASALAGKRYWLVLSCGSSESDYSADGAHGRPLEDYLPPFRQTVALCHMVWENPLILYGAHKIDNSAVDAHIDAFRQRLSALAHATPYTESDLNRDGT